MTFVDPPPRHATHKVKTIRFSPAGSYGDFECSYNGYSYMWCESPLDLVNEFGAHLLDDLDHRLQVRRVGTTSPVATLAWTYDPVRPERAWSTDDRDVVTLKGSHVFTWKAADYGSGIASYDTRVSISSQRARREARRARYERVKRARRRVHVPRGKIACLHVRARDRVGNAARWSRVKCVARPFADSQLKRDGKARIIRSRKFLDGKAIRISPVWPGNGEVRLPGVKRGSRFVVVYPRRPQGGDLMVGPKGLGNVSLSTKGRHQACTVHVVEWFGHSRRDGRVRLSASFDGVVLDGLAVIPRWFEGVRNLGERRYRGRCR